MWKWPFEKLPNSRRPDPTTSQAEYETDSFEKIQSSPSPLAGDPDPVQSGLVGQKPIQSNPIHLVRTVKVCVHCVKWYYIGIYSFV